MAQDASGKPDSMGRSVDFSSPREPEPWRPSLRSRWECIQSAVRFFRNRRLWIFLLHLLVDTRSFVRIGPAQCAPKFQKRQRARNEYRRSIGQPAQYLHGVIGLSGPL